MALGVVISTMRHLVLATLLVPALASAQPRDERIRFSGKRLAIEIVGGELVGLLSTGLTFNALCSGTDCLGSALTAYGVDFAVTPLTVWGIGEAMGGAGSLGYTYLGGTAALAAFSVPGSPDETASEALSRISLEAYMAAVMLAPCSAVLYELTSHVTWTREHQIGVAVRAIDGTTGAIGMISGRW